MAEEAPEASQGPSIGRPRSEKCRPKGHHKIDAGKVSEMDAKMVPKRDQNGPKSIKNPEKTPSKNHPKNDSEKVEKMRGKCSQNDAKMRSEIYEFS